MKAKEFDRIRNLSVDELRTELRTARERKMKLQFKHRSTPLANPLELRELSRKIARIETFMKEKSLEKSHG